VPFPNSKYAKITVYARGSALDPSGELTAIPRLLSWILQKERGRNRKGGDVRGRDKQINGSSCKPKNTTTHDKVVIYSK